MADLSRGPVPPLVGGAGRGRIAVFGATSGIARSVAARLRAQGEELILIGRDAAGLKDLARELGDEGIPQVTWDALDFDSHAGRFRALAATYRLQGVFYAAGVLFPQDECERDPAKARLTFDANLTSAALILDRFAAHFRAEGGGFISCLSSVAGDRGLAALRARREVVYVPPVWRWIMLILRAIPAPLFRRLKL